MRVKLAQSSVFFWSNCMASSNGSRRRLETNLLSNGSPLGLVSPMQQGINFKAPQLEFNLSKLKG
jgi:hypothetical protein